MHKWGFCLLLIGLNGLALAQNSGEVHAFPTMSNYDKALKNAKAEGKFIFIDAYTDWCGWCKVMEKKTFSDSTVRAKMQDYANCYRLEMEKETIGQQLKMKYGVGVFPSFLILTAEGNLHRVIEGFHEKEQWVQLLDSIYKLSTPARPNIPKELKLDWPTFMNAFQQSNFRKNYPSDSVIVDYFKDFKWNNYTYFMLAKQLSYKLPPRILDSFIEHKLQLNGMFGADLTGSVIQSMHNSIIMKSIEKGDLQAINVAIQKYLASNPNDKWMEFSCMVEFYKKKKDFSEMAKWIDRKMEVLNSEGLNEHAWFMYEECNDTTLLYKALTWADESIRKSENFQNLDTKASLLFKVGRLDEADKMALRAIEAGRKEEENVEGSLELRKKIQQSKGIKK